jgi:hypothetical protein
MVFTWYDEVYVSGGVDGESENLEAVIVTAGKRYCILNAG